LGNAKEECREEACSDAQEVQGQAKWEGEHPGNPLHNATRPTHEQDEHPARPFEVHHNFLPAGSNPPQRKSGGYNAGRSTGPPSSSMPVERNMHAGHHGKHRRGSEKFAGCVQTGNPERNPPPERNTQPAHVLPSRVVQARDAG
jgi:hypothetical protein